MEVNDAIYGRRAIRTYAREPVPREALRMLVDAAVQAPSAMNEQPWVFTIVTEQTLLARISRAATAHLLATDAFGAHGARLRPMLSDPAYQIFYGAPALVVIAAPEDGPFAVADCALAAQNLLLAACAAGLGTCWIGLAQPWLASAEGRATLGLAAHLLPVAPIIVGRPQATPGAVVRKSPDVRWLI
ncbi:MAG: nitroreductase family protein [Alphaproteobacteria bacterium]